MSRRFNYRLSFLLVILGALATSEVALELRPSFLRPGLHLMAYVGNTGDGTLTVIDVKDPSYKVVQTVATQNGARTMAFDSGNGRVYLVTAEMGPRPAATEAVPHPRPPVLPGSFQILVVERK